MSSTYPLHFYNSQSRQVEAFESLEAGKVKLYVCGPTVYNDAHLGHARCYITWDVLFRTLQFFGYEVTYARNLTDVDDKIIQRAVETGTTPEAIATTYTQRFHEDLARLNTLSPTIEPKATEHIDAMHAMIATLIEKDHAYVTDDGVYFHTPSMPTYGKLARKPLDALQAGARVDVNTQKRHSADFALWKRVDESADAYGWASPWGFGRPGWHIECSAMIFQNLGQQIDIHAGGADLMFPHHENEIAQSECCSGHPFVKTWMHNGFVNVDGEKMSKSLGNFATVRDLFEHYDANTLRYFMLGHHYRMPVDFTPDALNGAKARWHKLLQQFAKGMQLAQVNDVWLKEAVLHSAKWTCLEEKHPDFVTVLAQDMNTPRALAEWGRTFKDLKQSQDADKAKALLNTLVQEAWVLGFDLLPALAYLEDAHSPAEGEFHVVDGVAPAEKAHVLAQLEARRQAKLAKDFASSDAIRNALQAKGLHLVDRAGGWTTASSTADMT
ncbi:MAG: cysteine--tRNA ligase [Vampirovibrionales bacterium]